MNPQSFPIGVQFLRIFSVFLRTFSVDSPACQSDPWQIYFLDKLIFTPVYSAVGP